MINEFMVIYVESWSKISNILKSKLFISNKAYVMQKIYFEIL